jgi:Domain of unknown function (DUF5666)
LALNGVIVNRNLASCCALACALVLSSLAPAASANVGSASSFRVTARGSLTGTITALSGSSFTIQTAGRRTGIVNALTAAAAHVTNQDYPYVYGGGHLQAGIASIGIKGPGYNGKRTGYDCSGSVAAVLASAGLWPAGGGVPNDAGIIAQLLQEHLITRGAGTGPVEVTLYDHPGVHIFMNIDGRFFGTSDGGGGGNPHGGAGWLDDGAPDASSRSYKPYHFFPWVLKGSTTAGHIDSFQLGALAGDAAGLQLGVKVRVTYEQRRSGSMFATDLAYPGAINVGGTVQSIAGDGSSLTIQTAGGDSLTLATDDSTQLLENVAPGDSVEVTYLKSGSTLIALALTVTATAPPSTSGPSSNDGSGNPDGSDAPGGPDVPPPGPG